MQVRRPAEKELVPFQQASPTLHVETWAGLLSNQGLRISGEVEIVLGVLFLWLVLDVLITLLSHLGQAELFGTCWAGHLRRKQTGLVYGCSVVPSKGRIFFLPFAQQETGQRRDCSTQRGRSLVIPRALVRMCTGKAPLSGLTLAGGAGRCLLVCGGLSHP